MSIYRNLLKLLLILTFFFVSLVNANAQLEKRCEIINKQDIVDTGKCVSFLLDEDEELTIDKVLYNSSFKAPADKKFNLGFIDGVAWFRIKANTFQKVTQYFINFEYPILEKISIYVIQNNKILESFQIGLGRKSKGNLKRIRKLSVPLRVEAGNFEIFYRIKSESSIQYRAFIYPASKQQDAIDTENIILGATSGIILVMILYNFFIFLSVRDRSYFYYCIYIFFHYVAQLNYYGYLAWWLWPESPWWAVHSIRCILGVFYISALLFSRHFLNAKETIPIEDKIMSYLIPLTFIQIGLSLSEYHIISAYVTALYSLVYILTIFISGLHALIKGNRDALFFLIAWIALLLGSFALLLKTMGVLPDYFIFTHGMRIGSVLEIVLLSIALADKIKRYRNEKLVAQETMLQHASKAEKLQRQLNEELNIVVDSRTKELEKKKIEMEEQINMARSIQQSLLPSQIPEITGAKIAYLYHPMSSLGGDFVDVIIKKNEVALFICDVSGHGVPAALLASMVKVSLSNWKKTIDDPVATLTEIHQNMQPNLGGHFLTAQLLYINLENKSFSLASAGHIPLFHLNSTEISLLNPKGRFISEIAEPNYLSLNGKLHSGDKMIMMTDGITEVHSQTGGEYTESGVIKSLESKGNLTINSICQKVIHSARHFGDYSEPEDDMAIIGIEIY